MYNFEGNTYCMDFSKSLVSKSKYFIIVVREKELSFVDFGIRLYLYVCIKTCQPQNEWQNILTQKTNTLEQKNEYIFIFLFSIYSNTINVFFYIPECQY